MVGRVFADGTIQLSINADTADYVVHTAAGSPAAKVDVVVTIASGVVVYQSGGTAGLRTGSFATGSKVKIINRGSICGKGGAGGAGGAGTGAAGSNGAGGGDALRHEGQTLEIDNSSGYILGAGGGAGGGEGRSGSGGGGGGSGRGRTDTSGGSGGTGTSPGSPGGTGTYSGYGIGGASGGAPAQSGGDGGDWGSQGEDGNAFLLSPSTGGAPGYAVRITAGSVVWLGGYTSAQVQGAVG